MKHLKKSFLILSIIATLLLNTILPPAISLPKPESGLPNFTQDIDNLDDNNH